MTEHWSGEDPERGCGLMLAVLLSLPLWAVIILAIALVSGLWRP